MAFRQRAIRTEASGKSSAQLQRHLNAGELMHKDKRFKKPMSPLSFPLTLNVINLRRRKENPETSGNTLTWKRTKWVIYSYFFDVFSFDFSYSITYFPGAKTNFTKMGRSRIGDSNISFHGEPPHYNLLHGIELASGFSSRMARLFLKEHCLINPSDIWIERERERLSTSSFCFTAGLWLICC